MRRNYLLFLVITVLAIGALQFGDFKTRISSEESHVQTPAPASQFESQDKAPQTLLVGSECNPRVKVCEES